MIQSVTSAPANAPLVDPKSGRVNTDWLKYFENIASGQNLDQNFSNVHVTSAFLGSQGSQFSIDIDASSLQGTTLAAGIVASSLTSVGTLTGGATGQGFTIDLTASTVNGNLPWVNLPTGTGKWVANPTIAGVLGITGDMEGFGDVYAHFGDQGNECSLRGTLTGFGNSNTLGPGIQFGPTTNPQLDWVWAIEASWLLLSGGSSGGQGHRKLSFLRAQSNGPVQTAMALITDDNVTPGVYYLYAPQGISLNLGTPTGLVSDYNFISNIYGGVFNCLSTGVIWTGFVNYPQVQVQYGFGSQMGRLTMLTSGQTMVSHNLSFNGSFNLDSITNSGWCFRMVDTSGGDVVQILRASAGANPRTPAVLLQLDANSVVTLTGTLPRVDFATTGVTNMGHVLSTGTNIMWMSQNITFNGSNQWILDNTANSGWLVGMDDSGGGAGSDIFAILRAPAGANPVTPATIFKIDATGLMYYFGPTSGTATAGAVALPANPVGFFEIFLSGTTYKVPFYAV